MSERHEAFGVPLHSANRIGSSSIRPPISFAGVVWNPGLADRADLGPLAERHSPCAFCDLGPSSASNPGKHRVTNLGEAYEAVRRSTVFSFIRLGVSVIGLVGASPMLLREVVDVTA